jgi:hypothetical protein
LNLVLRDLLQKKYGDGADVGIGEGLPSGLGTGVGFGSDGGGSSVSGLTYTGKGTSTSPGDLGSKDSGFGGSSKGIAPGVLGPILSLVKGVLIL